jgi:hypothetical protein
MDHLNVPLVVAAKVGESLLGELMNAGILTEAEFQQQKARILNG